MNCLRLGLRLRLTKNVQSSRLVIFTKYHLGYDLQLRLQIYKLQITIYQLQSTIYKVGYNLQSPMGHVFGPQFLGPKPSPPSYSVERMANKIATLVKISVTVKYANAVSYALM